MSFGNKRKIGSHRRAKHRNLRKITPYQKRAMASDEVVNISDTPTRLYLDIVKYRAKRNNIKYSVSDEYLKRLYASQGRRCAISGLEILFYVGKSEHGSRPRAKALTTASLDRIDSTKGYVEGNVRWVHKDYNMLKCDLSDKRLLEMCSIVVEFNKKRQDEHGYNI